MAVQTKAKPSTGNNSRNSQTNKTQAPTANSTNGRGSSPEATKAGGDDVAVTEVVVGESITVRDLARLMERSPIDLIKVLMQYGIMAPITHTIDHDTAVILGEDLGIKVFRPEPVVVEDELEDEADVDAEPKTPEEAASAVVETRKSYVQEVVSRQKGRDLIERPPIVAVLGHVDHGKTTLLDQIRKTDVVSGEAGGITQRTGAYQVSLDGRKITFLDTPGHEAFTAMRARGAQVTDIVVLVVAADDGIMPQTREAINHARAAGVQIVVALNKIDRPNANIERVFDELAQAGLQAEAWGGETIVVETSALQGTGIDDLLENILVVAELEEYKANPKGDCIGTIVEAEVDKYRGVTATLLVQNGTLKKGDSIVVGSTWGKIKAMFDDNGKAIRTAGPSTPVVILGLQEVPEAGSVFERVKDDRTAKRIVAERQDEAERNDQRPTQRQMSLEDLFARIEGGEVKTLNLVVRADMQGTLEPVVKSIEELGDEEVQVKILQAAIGDVSESDIMLAEASEAVIIGFSVQTDKAALVRAEASGVEVRHYDIIYKLLEDLQDALTGMLDPIYEEVKIGEAQVLQLFKLRRTSIAGCNVLNGVVKRNGIARIVRRGKEIASKTTISTLRRFTEDVNEVRAGFECGIRLANFDNELEEGDVIAIYEEQRTR